MATKPKKPAPVALQIFDRIRGILESARANVARTINTTQVVANWLIGREIVEEEQRGKKRAGYGAELLADLAERLKSDFGSGYGVDNLELFRRFYLEYPRLLVETNSDALRRKSDRSVGATPNSDAMPRKSASLPLQPLAHVSTEGEPWSPGQLSPNLSWTHYRRLLRWPS